MKTAGDKYGFHVRGPQRRVRSQPSPTQQRRRNSFTAAQNAWKNSTTPQQRRRWLLAAPPPLTGRLWFIKINSIRIFNNLTPILEPPTK